MGRASTELTAGEPYLVDEANSVEIQLIDRDQWLTSCDDEALVNGSNLAILGCELIQFGRAIPLGGGGFRLERLLRGRGGSEWASSRHTPGELFVLIERDSLQPVRIPAWAVGSEVDAEESAMGGETASAIVSGETLRPPSPVALKHEFVPDGSLIVQWTRRSRRGWSWVDEVDAPLAEAREQYRVTLTGSGIDE